MATHSSSTTVPSNDTDAEFRAWATFFHDVFNLAWVQTSDTGQINLGTVTTPGAPNTSQGYEIWRMNDSLQSTFPVFVKIEYGSGAATISPAIWITIGKGSDGSGGITTIRFARTQISSNAENNGNHLSYGSAATNRVGVAFAVDGTGTARPVLIFIERSKDSAGADTSDGLVVIYNLASSTIMKSVNYVKMNQVAQPDPETTHYIRSRNAAFDSNVAMGVIIPIAGVAQQPGMNMFIARAGDFSASGSPTISIYGNTVTLQGLGPLTPILINNSSNDTTAVCFMRFE